MLSVSLAALLSLLPQPRALAGDGPPLGRDLLGDDPLSRQIRTAGVSSVMWVRGPHGERVPMKLGPEAAAGAESPSEPGRERAPSVAKATRKLRKASGPRPGQPKGR